MRDQPKCPCWSGADMVCPEHGPLSTVGQGPPDARREGLAEALYLALQGDDRRVTWEREKQIRGNYSLAPHCYYLADAALAHLDAA